MAIPVVCVGCGKSFSVPEKFVGKRGKCKHCGTIFVIPASLVAADPDLIPFIDERTDAPDAARAGNRSTSVPQTPSGVEDARSRMRSSRAGEPIFVPQAPPAPLPMGAAPRANVRTFEQATTDRPAIGAPASRGWNFGTRGRSPSARQDAPQRNAFLDISLPWILIVLGFVGPLAFQLFAAYRVMRATGGITINGQNAFTPLFNTIAVSAVTFVLVTLPITVLGVYIAGRVLKAELAGPVIVKVFAIISSVVLVLTIAVLLHIPSADAVALLFTDVAYSLLPVAAIVIYGLTLLFFRMETLSTTVLWLFTAFFYAAGMFFNNELATPLIGKVVPLFDSRITGAHPVAPSSPAQPIAPVQPAQQLANVPSADLPDHSRPAQYVGTWTAKLVNPVSVFDQTLVLNSDGTALDDYKSARERNIINGTWEVRKGVLQVDIKSANSFTVPGMSVPVGTITETTLTTMTARTERGEIRVFQRQ